jgi:hypothetical protein
MLSTFHGTIKVVLIDASESVLKHYTVSTCLLLAVLINPLFNICVLLFLSASRSFLVFLHPSILFIRKIQDPSSQKLSRPTPKGHSAKFQSQSVYS